MISRGKKVLVYINKKWVHTWLVCASCWYIPYCNQCDIPIWVYQNNHKHLFGLCPVCQTTYPTFVSCPKCSHSMSWYGIGIQMITEECEHLFGVIPLVISSSTSGSFSKSQNLLTSIKNSSLLVATSLLQSPLIDDIGLIVVQNANTPAIPDINTQLHHFQFLEQLFTYNQADHILLQTSTPESMVLQSLLWEQPEIFYQQDEAMKTKHYYPPFGEICIITYRHEMESVLYTKVNTLFHDLLSLKSMNYQWSHIDIFALPASVYKMYNKFRYQIIIKWPTIRPFMDRAFVELSIYQRWFKLDRGATGFM